MANEPNRAEDELKRYAAERRAQAPAELDAGTRRVLQGEMARVYGKPREGVAWWKRVLLAPRFAWAVSLTAILGVSFLALNRPPPAKRGEILETADKKTGTSDRSQGEETQRREGAKAQSEAKKLEAGSADLTVATDVTEARGAAATAPVASAPAPRMTTAPTLPEPSREVRSRRMTEAQPVLEKSVASLADANETFFLNTAPQAQAKDQVTQNSAQVLSRFKMQEAGKQVRFDDADGSTYSGPVTANAGTNLFRVTGTNRTLQQPVVFSGQYFRMAPQQQDLRQNQNQNQLQQTQFAQEQVRVQGQAQVGNSQVQVDAQAPAPAQ